MSCIVNGITVPVTEHIVFGDNNDNSIDSSMAQLRQTLGQRREKVANAFTFPPRTDSPL